MNLLIVLMVVVKTINPFISYCDSCGALCDRYKVLRYIYPKVLCDSYGALRYRSALDTTQKFLNKVTCGALRYRQKSEIVAAKTYFGIEKSK
jgi:hypothetical protein